MNHFLIQILVIENYITHVRVIEDSQFPYARPPPNQPESAKKHRILIISVRNSGRVRMHKARQNANSVFQIGKSWNLEDLTQIENDLQVPTGFTMTLGKNYYWNTRTPKEKEVFINSTIKIYNKYTGGKTPILIGFDGQSTLPGSPVATANTSADNRNRETHQSADSTNQRQNSQTNLPSGHPNNNAYSKTYSASHENLSRSNTELNHLKTRPHNSATNVSQMPPGRPHAASISGGSPNSSETNLNRNQMQSLPRSNSVSANMAPSNKMMNHSPSMPAIPPPRQQRSNTVKYSNPAIKPSPLRTQSVSSRQEHEPARDIHQKAMPAANTPPPVPVITLNNEDTSENDNDNNNQFAEDETEAELKDLASNVIFDNNNHRSSVQSIKIFARKHDDNVIEEEPESPADENASPESNSFNGPGGRDNKSKVKPKPSFQEPGNDLQVLQENDSFDETTSISRIDEVARSRMSFINSNSVSAIEETLTQLNWTGRSDVKFLEMSITDEINLIEDQKLHNVVDLDDRLDELDQSLANGIKECEALDAIFAFFSVQLGSFGDQISHIEGQGQGLQVQTRNQKVLWTELNNILNTVALPKENFEILYNYQYKSIRDLPEIEKALIDLYQAVKAVRASGNDDSGELLGDMRALKEKRHIYEQASATVTSEVNKVVEQKVLDVISEAENKTTSANITEPKINSLEEPIFKTLMPFSAVILFVKEIDDVKYYEMVKSYETQLKSYYDDSSSSFFAQWTRLLLTSGDKTRTLFQAKESENITPKSLKRSQTLAKLKHNEPKGLERYNTLAGPNQSSSANSDLSEITSLLKPGPVRPGLLRAIEVVKSIIILEQEVLIKVFHQSSFGGSRYPDFVKVHTIAQRRIASAGLSEKIYEIDSDREKAHELYNIMSGIFGPLQDHLLKFAAQLLEEEVLDCPGVITALNIISKMLQASNLDFLNAMIQRLTDRITSIWNHFIDQQATRIGNTILSCKKRSGPIYVVRVFPMLCQRIEQDVSKEAAKDDLNSLPVRILLNDSYEKLGQAILTILQKMESDVTSRSVNPRADTVVSTADYEDKELMNYHVIMIENMHLFTQGLESLSQSVSALYNLRSNALQIYAKEQKLYIDFILHRPLGKLMNFFENVEQILRKNPNDNPAQKPGLNRSALKKILVNLDSKELKKIVDGLFKRVEKHFTEDSSTASAAAITSNLKLISKVWAQVQVQLLDYIKSYRPIIDRYYSTPGDSGYVCKFEITDQDIKDAFSTVQYST